MMNKIWSVRGLNEKYSDSELIEMISLGKLSDNSYISNADLKKWVKIEDTIYSFYLEEENENL